MKQLSEFETLQGARDYVATTYRDIGGNEARQFFALAGVLDSIEAAQASPIPCQNAEYGINTTVGQLAKAVIQTINNGHFATDPTKQDGQLNMIASLFLVENGVYPKAIHDAFFARAAITSKPHESATEHDWLKSRGVNIDKKQVSPVNGWLKITTTSDCEAHRPQVFADIQGTLQRVTGFGVVDKTGDYLAQVPRGYSALYVDNHYGVIA